MSRRHIEVDKPWHKSIPFAPGVVATGSLLFTSGITARKGDGSIDGVGDMRRQMEVCFANMAAVLENAGAGWEDMVKITMYTTDIDRFSKHADVWRGHFTGRPGSTLVEVSRLALPEMLVEIEAVFDMGDAA